MRRRWEPSTYRQAIVTFLDLLGFRELVRTRSAAEVGRIIELMHFFGGAAKDREQAAGTHVVSFSDSIVRVVDADRPSALFYEVLDVLHIQGELVNNGVLIRGGVTFGEVSVRAEGVFGPAFIRAYDLESKVAKVPRVVIDKPAIKAVASGAIRTKDEQHDSEWEVQEVLKLCRRDCCNDLNFVDYIKGFYDELDSPALYPDWLRAHANLVRRLMGAASIQGGSEPHGERLAASLQSKAEWLRDYRNAVVNGLSSEALAGLGATPSELLVA